MKTIIEMAQEAGGYFAELPNVDAWLFDDEKLLASFVEIIRADEREASAKLVDHILKEGGGTWGDAIRAKGNT